MRCIERGKYGASHGAPRVRSTCHAKSEGNTNGIDAAQAHYRQALALAEALGLRPLQAHCHLGLGALYRRAGTRQQAREHLTTAATMFGEMDMRYWREQAEAELKELA